MPWWRKQDWAASERSRRGSSVPSRTGGPGEQVNTEVRVSIPAQPDRTASATAPISTDRIAESLKRLGIRYLSDENNHLLAMWERHVVLFALEGPDDEILVIRARAYSGVPKDWAERAYTAVNEWNHTRRFLKSYVGDETESGLLSLYAEMQLPLVPGVHDALLDEVVDCAAAVSGSWVAWLY
ncbi:MAG: YbjN domain-containing protein, partial [Micromonosporaceae bacterium]